MKRTIGRGLAAAAATLAMSGAAHAADIWAGGYAHGVGTKQSQEGGADFMLGLQSDRIDALKYFFKPAVHGMIGANTNVSSDFVAVGFDWPIAILHSAKFYIRPGIGLAYTTGKADVGSAFAPGLSAQERDRRAHIAATRIDFGSSVLFEPELALGYRLSDKWRIEASYVHLSNGQILHQGKNQGLDDVGLRLGYRFR